MASAGDAPPELERQLIMFSLHGEHYGLPIARVREIIREADERRRKEGRGTILFCDEIHRFNKGQQDAFLPSVERGVRRDGHHQGSHQEDQRQGRGQDHPSRRRDRESHRHGHGTDLPEAEHVGEALMVTGPR